MWNAYDSWNVWRTYRVGSPMPNITDDQFDAVRTREDVIIMFVPACNVG